MTTGVILMTYGAPAGDEDVAAYLGRVRGHPPPAELVAEMRRRYRLIGGSLTFRYRAARFVLLHHMQISACPECDATAEVKGLKAFAPADRPPVAPVFWAFRVMVGLGLAMVGLGAHASGARTKHGKEEGCP